jgi:phosphopantetheinyl transferase
LSDQELFRRDQFQSDRRRNSFTMGRVAARRLLARRLGVSPKEVPLEVADDGGIDVVGHAVHLSISHTDHKAAAAASRHPVGVDLEPVRSRVDDLHTYVLHPDEYDLLENSSLDPARTTLLCWVVKEAVLKGMRLGLRRSPKEVKLRFDHDARWGVATIQSEEWRFNYYEEDRHLMAIAHPRALRISRPRI